LIRKKKEKSNMMDKKRNQNRSLERMDKIEKKKRRKKAKLK